MNNKDITTIRYIDDFVIIGKNKQIVNNAFKSAQKMLNEMGMDIYDPQTNLQKASEGLVDERGFDFLGCNIKLNGISPSRESQNNLIKNIDGTLKTAAQEIKNFSCINSNKIRSSENTYIQSLAKIDKQIKGWGDAFAFCTDTLYRHQLDEKLNNVITTYRDKFFQIIKSLPTDNQRRSLGIALLKDGKLHDVKIRNPVNRGAT